MTPYQLFSIVVGILFTAVFIGAALDFFGTLLAKPAGNA